MTLCQGMLLQPHTSCIYTHTGLCARKITYPLVGETPLMIYALVCTVCLGPAVPKITKKLWNKWINSVVHQTTELNFSSALYGLYYTENSEMQNLKRIETKNMKRILTICIFVTLFTLLMAK